jgi:hypothetical protein
MKYMLPHRPKKQISFLAIIGLMSLSFGLGVGTSKSYVTTAFKVGYDAAQQEHAKGAFLNSEELAKTACTEWWFNPKYRLHKGQK